jgi:hypothetical protein
MTRLSTDLSRANGPRIDPIDTEDGSVPSWRKNKQSDQQQQPGKAKNMNDGHTLGSRKFNNGLRESQAVDLLRESVCGCGCGHTSRNDVEVFVVNTRIDMREERQFWIGPLVAEAQALGNRMRYWDDDPNPARKARYDELCTEIGRWIAHGSRCLTFDVEAMADEYLDKLKSTRE